MILQGDNGITWTETEVIRGSRKTVKSIAIRTSRAKILEYLKEHPALKDAAREISDAYELRRMGWGYALLGIKTASMGSRGGEMSSEVIDSIRKKIGRLHGWEFYCPPEWRKSVAAIEELGLTARQYSLTSGRSPTTIMDWYKRGLNDYSIRQGWGNQL